MTFSRVKPAGWTDNVDTITATQINTIDANLANAVDGASGGTYAGAVTWTGQQTFDGLNPAVDNLTITKYLGLASGRTTFSTSATGDWAPGLGSGGDFSLIDQHTPAAGASSDLTLSPQLPECNIVSVTAYYVGAGGHAALPAAMPRLRAAIVAPSGANVFYDSVTDSSVSTAAYQVVHTITLPFAHPFDPEFRSLIIQFDGESGVNSIAGANLYYIALEYSPITVL